MNQPSLGNAAAALHLHTMETPFGARDLYDCVSFCNRCGCCAQVCPFYKIQAQEENSPRGKNQLLRLALEGKIKLSLPNSTLRRALQTCTLCGRCTQACAGKIPTAELVLEMRRHTHWKALPTLLHAFLNLRDTHPRLFYLSVRLALILRRAGFLSLLRALRLTALPGLRWLNHADDILPRSCPPLERVLSPQELETPRQPTLLYLPSLETEFLLPQLVKHTLSFLRQQNQVPCLWRNRGSGLFAYVYGDLRLSRQRVRQLIQAHAQAGNGQLPLLTDSIDVYHFLKRSPQLFSAYPKAKAQAEQFARCVRFVADYLPATPHAGDEKVQLEYGALLEREGTVFEQIRQILTTNFGRNFVQCLYTDVDVPAFGYAFSAQNSAEKIGLQVVQRIARTQTKRVFALSGMAVLELNFLLKKFYPTATAQHIVQIEK